MSICQQSTQLFGLLLFFKGNELMQLCKRNFWPVLLKFGSQDFLLCCSSIFVTQELHPLCVTCSLTLSIIEFSHLRTGYSHQYGTLALAHRTNTLSHGLLLSRRLNIKAVTYFISHNSHLQIKLQLFTIKNIPFKLIYKYKRLGVNISLFTKLVTFWQLRKQNRAEKIIKVILRDMITTKGNKVR